MTKAEELKILEEIEELILEAGPDSYIRMTFEGVPEICRRNIEDDFGDQPVQDLDHVRMILNAEQRSHDETKRMLADAQNALKESLDLNDLYKRTADEWEKNAHDAGDLYCDLEKECAQKDVEICNLKAEIVRMKLERMTDVEYAELYECMRKE